MSMKLFRILGAIGHDTPLTKIDSALGVFAKESNISNLFRGAVKDGDVWKIGNKTTTELETSLKLGKIADSAPVIYKMEYVPSSLNQKLINEVKDLPSYRVGKVEKGVDDIKNLFKDTNEYSNLINPNHGNLTINMVENNAKLKSTIGQLIGKRYKSLTLGVVIVGASITVAIEKINEHRKNMSGCFRYYMENDVLVSCRVATCSCFDGSPITSGGAVTCSPSLIPKSMSGLSNCSGTTGAVCAKCPSEEVLTVGKGDLNNPTSLTQDSTEDLVYYKCNQASILDAIGDLVGDGVDGLVDEIKKGKEIFTDFFKYALLIVKYVLMVGGIVGAIILLYYGYTKVSGFSKGPTESRLQTI